MKNAKGKKKNETSRVIPKSRLLRLESTRFRDEQIDHGRTNVNKWLLAFTYARSTIVPVKRICWIICIHILFQVNNNDRRSLYYGYT